jgi:TDG/mug DNA glycosylase family protein
MKRPRRVLRFRYVRRIKPRFWKIIADRVPHLPSSYASRVEILIKRGIALWDVLAAATRSGSLDAAIAKDAIPNNFRAFFNAHPHISVICFNGATAATLYKRHVMPTLTDKQRLIAKDTLPSTSGAHASLHFVQKVARWSVLWSPTYGINPNSLE